MRRVALLPLLLLLAMLPGELIAMPDSTALLDMLRGARFRSLSHVTDLPPAVLRACVDDPKNVADPGGPFNSTDAGELDHPKPRTRLAWAATDGEHYVAEFEYGGIGYHRTVLVIAFDRAKDAAKVLAEAQDVNASSVDELIKAASASSTPFWSAPGRFH
jgi:hypothetical protein